MNVTSVFPYLKMEFNVSETMKVLTHDPSIYWSWGVSNKYNLNNKGLLLKVNGHHHKGFVLITLDWSDTYNVYILTKSLDVIAEYSMIYFDNLVEVIDNRIERIEAYQR